MNIGTLITDIYGTIQDKSGWFSSQLANEFADDIAKRLQSQLGADKGPPRLRLSQMGPKCPKALWHSIHTPELATPLPPRAEITYAYGHIVEALAIALAKAAGHEVTGEQDAVYVDGVPGHRDCVIDGYIVDVKSCGKYLFDRFKNKSIGQTDSFGYLDQLDGYMVGSLNDPLVRVKDTAFILAVDKQLGNMVLYEHKLRYENIRRRLSLYKDYVGRSEPPACQCQVVPLGKSGNFGLDTKASYNVFKYTCFPNLRTFIYADGPVYLTTIVKKPDVLEVDKHGNPVFD